MTVDIGTVGLVTCSFIWGFTAIMVTELYASYMSGYRRSRLAYIKDLITEWKYNTGRLHLPPSAQAHQVLKELVNGIAKAVARELEDVCDPSVPPAVVAAVEAAKSPPPPVPTTTIVPKSEAKTGTKEKRICPCLSHGYDEVD